MENFYNQIRNIVSASNKDNIIILGKGESARHIPAYVLDDALVININDSGLFYRGTFSLIAERYTEGDDLINEYSDYYICSKEFNNNTPNIVVSYNPLSHIEQENFITYLDDEDYYLTDFLLLSAIKLSAMIAQVWQKETKVILVGFDFSSDVKSIGSDITIHNKAYKDALFKLQSEILRRVVFHYNQNNNSLIRLLHIGNLDYSCSTVLQYVQEYKISQYQTYKSNQQLYDDLIVKMQNGHTLLVAEITNNHLGSIERLKTMIVLAKQQGADMIKVQKRDVASFYTEKAKQSPYKSPFGSTLYDYRQGVELNDEMMETLIVTCRQYQIFWFSSVLDEVSMDFMNAYNQILMKLPSTISNHRDYLRKARMNFAGDLVVSTGYTDYTYEEFVLNELTTKNSRLFLLQCTSSYPAPPESCQLSVIRHYEYLSQKYENIYAGYSSHDLDNHLSQMAVAAGAKMIEKHVKLGSVDWVHFDSVALDLSNNEFANFVKDVRWAEKVCGSTTKTISNVEHHKY